MATGRSHLSAQLCRALILLPSSLLFVLVAALLTVLPACSPEGEIPPLAKQQRLRVATTTSLYDTGLWGYLEPMFEEEYGVELDILYAGTGKALEWGRRGDVDVITVHARAEEEEFVAEGYGVERTVFALNHFLIVGPEADPAGIRGLSPKDAFRQVMEKGKMVSRGDNSGTHTKEKTIWKNAGYEYEQVRKSGPWYVEAGSGMGPTLMMANEMSAYTLADIGSFLAYKAKLDLVALVEEGDILLNVYSAIAVNPEKAKVNFEMANNLIAFLTSPQIQELIAACGVREYGRQLFTPCAGQDL